MRVNRAGAALIIVAMTGCVGLPPVLPPMPGCYTVQASAWSAEFASATGIKELPPVIGIDTNPERAVLVPLAWRRQVPDSSNVATWTDHSADWEIHGDLVRNLGRDKYYRMAGDSMRVTWGWKGIATALLSPTPTGFEGPMQLGIRPMPSAAQSRLALTRRDCTGLRFVSARPPA